MKKTTAKTTAKTIDDVETLMAVVAAADAAARKITAQMDAEILRIREKYAAALDTENARRADAEADIASWAELNRSEFGPRRSIDLTHGTLGWRLGNPSVSCRPRVKTAAALELVAAKLPEYIRTVTEIDKASILSAYAGKAISDDDLAACGLRITQTERFYVTPKTEEIPNDRH